MDMPIIEKERTCFFAGHRPYRFSFTPEDQNLFYTNLAANISKAVRELFENGCDTFLCGGTIGFDVMCSEAVVELKKEFPQIRLGCILPFENHHSDFSSNWQARFLKILDACDFIDYVSPEEVTGCYYDRNQKMIENSAYMITYFDGRGGGTARVIAAAQLNKLKIFNLYEAPSTPENISFFVGYDRMAKNSPPSTKPNINKK